MESTVTLVTVTEIIGRTGRSKSPRIKRRHHPGQVRVQRQQDSPHSPQCQGTRPHRRYSGSHGVRARGPSPQMNNRVSLILTLIPAPSMDILPPLPSPHSNLLPHPLLHSLYYFNSLKLNSFSIKKWLPLWLLPPRSSQHICHIDDSKR